MNTPRLLSSLLATLATGVFAASALAIPIISTGNTPQSDENVLFSSDASGLVVQGTLNTSGAVVNFASPTTLISPSSGQARIEAADENDAFQSLTFSLDDGGTFTSAIFNIFGDAGMVDISVSYGMAPSILLASFDTSNGSNFFTIVGNDTLLTQITLTTTESFNDIRQVRIGGYEAPAVDVPDSGLSVIFVGMGLLGLATLRRFRVR